MTEVSGRRHRLDWAPLGRGFQMDAVERRFVVTAVLSFALLIVSVAWLLVN